MARSTSTARVAGDGESPLAGAVEKGVRIDALRTPPVLVGDLVLVDDARLRLEVG